jgi:hypothetical protein
MGYVDDLALRMAALDPEAGSAVRVITYFDSLVASRAGLQSIVRGAATLAGCPAALLDPARRLTVRVLEDGAAAGAVGTSDPDWASMSVTDDGAVLVLERPGPADPLRAVILERAASAARAVLERTRGPGRPGRDDPALLELLLDGEAPEVDRLAAAGRLGVSDVARVLALADGGALVGSTQDAIPPDQRIGVGPAVPVLGLPASWAAASLALRLTADGTEHDPGPRVVFADQLGPLALLVRAADAEQAPVPDVQQLLHAAAAAPWVLCTLDAVAGASSLRDAARALRLHHSTLQDRLVQAESLLGWSVRAPQGLLRLQLALALRRSLRTRRMPT